MFKTRFPITAFGNDVVTEVPVTLALSPEIRKVRLTAKDGGNAVRLSGTISADRQGWWKCSKIVWNNLC
ncbi:MAG: hypothetical protein HFP77_03745 [Methylococcales symbiont of Iophon sp. n. MRB-2018]|nr:MAG: hypothetical protein HFP77_03745 [Methylococcales symbiont of Iophon sp. n. MRB-2018]KAF3979565.1 MAG: hypothetical protein HFP76_06490 [Methylococcales symbiont of Iophon sp. n. MRB-2018]